MKIRVLCLILPVSGGEVRRIGVSCAGLELERRNARASPWQKRLVESSNSFKQLYARFMRG